MIWEQRSVETLGLPRNGAPFVILAKSVPKSNTGKGQKQ